jgi:hypothetical protein
MIPAAHELETMPVATPSEEEIVVPENPFMVGANVGSSQLSTLPESDKDMRVRFYRKSLLRRFPGRLTLVARWRWE